MRHSRLSIIVGVWLSLLTPSAFAQLPAAKPSAPLAKVAGADKSIAKSEADRIREGHRLQARSMLFSLSSDARRFHDQTLRARSLARIADAVWDVDAEQAKALFREAWDAAEKADRESQEPSNLRREVLTLAAKRDRLLAEEFLQKLKAGQQESSGGGSAGSNLTAGANLWQLPEAAEKRLKLASDLLGEGDIARALQFADPVLGSVTISTLEFLTQLREKNPVEADRRYAVMLANTSQNPSADANTISLLSSYIFTPDLFVIFETDGSASSSMIPPLKPAISNPQLRLAFFQTASGVLLQPQPPPEQDQSTTGVIGKYMALKRLMPLFQQYAPQDIAEAMQGQFEALNALMTDDVRQNDNEWVRKGISPEKTFADQEHSLMDDIDRAKTSDERDQLYFNLALLALDANEMKARDYVSKINETSFRKRAQAWVDWSLAAKAVKNKKVETALELARNGELTHIQRVWVLTQTAKLLAKTDRDKAMALLDDAMSETRLIDRDDLDRPRGSLAVANALRVLAPARAWDALSDAVAAANWVDGFTGEDGEIKLNVNSKSKILTKMESAPDFKIDGVFAEMAKIDFDRAALVAGEFKGEAPRTNAIIAVARAALNEKAPGPEPRPALKN
jgi:hypothetical protein